MGDGRRSFELTSVIDWATVRSERVEYASGDSAYTQGDAAGTVMYIDRGGIRLSVVSYTGKEAVIAILESGDFFGESCLAGSPKRTGTATAMGPTAVLRITREELVRQLHRSTAFADRFLSHMLKRNLRIERDLTDQLFNNSEKRLARTLLLLARYGEDAPLRRKVPKISQEVLAEMIGSTRTRVNFFMNRFRSLGYIEYRCGGDLTINESLLNVVLGD